jgi:hypothetical protein
LECAVTRSQEHYEGLKFKGEYQLLAYSDENIEGEKTDTMQKNTEALLGARKQVGLEVYVNVMLSESRMKAWHKDSQ